MTPTQKVRSRYRPVRLVVLVAFALLGMGCNGDSLPDMAEVSGVILLDGKPLDEVEIVFMPVPGLRPESVDPQASGYSDPAGRFRPETRIEGHTYPGVVVATHRVAVRDLKRLSSPVPDPRQETAGETPSRRPGGRFSPRFADLMSGPFPTVAIGQGPQTIRIELDSKSQTGRATVTRDAEAG